jgi:hypothetical protein
MLSRIAGDFDGDHARDRLLAYAELEGAGQPSRWHVRAELATGHVAGLALDTTSVGPNGLVARRAVDANGDGRSTYTWTRTSYRWITGTLVRADGSTSGSFVAAPEDPLPPELRTRCGSGTW